MEERTEVVEVMGGAAAYHRLVPTIRLVRHFAHDQEGMVMTAIGVAVVGCGVAGEQHVAALARHDGAHVRCLYDVDVARSARCGQRYDVARVTDRLDQVLGDPKIDAVVVATPPSSHAEIALAAIEAGKHVLVEKPLAHDVEVARSILHAARARPDLVVMECSSRHARLHAKFERVRSRVEAGGLGEIYAIHHRGVRRHLRPGLEYQPGSDWFASKAVAGGGPLLDFGVYDLAFHFGVLGERPGASALLAVARSGLDRQSSAADFEVEEHGIVTMRLAGGGLYHWERGTHAHGPAGERTRIYGNRGGVELAYPSWCDGTISWFHAGREDAEIETVEVDPGQAAWADFVRMDDHFLACVTGRERPAVTLAEAVDLLALIGRAYDSSATEPASSAEGSA